MVPMYGVWYYSAWSQFNDIDISINVFATVFLDTFIYEDRNDLYMDYLKSTFEDKAKYYFNLYRETSDSFLKAVFVNPYNDEVFNHFSKAQKKRNTIDWGEFCVENRQRKFIKYESSFNNFGSLQIRNTMLHHDLVKVAEKLSFKLNHNRFY